MDQAQATGRWRREVPGPAKSAEQQGAPYEIGDLEWQPGQGDGQPCHWGRADITRQLCDLDSRAQRIESLLLKPQVVDRLPAVTQADLGSRVIESEVVVKVVRYERLRPLIEIEGGEEDRGDAARGKGEVAPVLSSAHPRRM